MKKPEQKLTSKITVHTIEFYKTYLVRNKRLLLGISAYEQSFLMGKRDLFVRDIENPTETLRYSIDDTNYLLLIYDEKISSFILPKAEQDMFLIDIVATYQKDAKNADFEIRKHLRSVNEDGFLKQLQTKGTYSIINEKKDVLLPTSLNLSTQDDVKSFIDFLIDGGFFDEPKRALDVFNRCKLKFGSNFHPRYMIKALVYFTDRKSGTPKLDKKEKNEFGRTLFKRVKK